MLGNRYIQSLWTVLPHKTPPLDLSELESVHITHQIVKPEVVEYHDTESQGKGSNSQEYLEMHKRESEI